MNKEFVIKNRQIGILKNIILSSGLIDEDILNDASKLYYDNPYHNFLHVLRVTSYVLLLNKNDFSPLEIRSLMIAGLFHDAGHTGTAMELDEFISLDHFRRTMDKYPDFVVDDSICRHGIIGTVFKNRSKNKNKYSKIMSDLDVGDIGAGIVDFIYYGSLFALELGVSAEHYYTEVEKGYFKYLMSIDKFIMISSEAREVLPNSLKTIREFYNIPLEKKLSMFETLKNEDITLDEFREKYFN
ncbi:MAG: hypothetical protein PHI37_01410 [Candidatus Gracilibacteria bacterium]|nr:hypothetical protein [Candidatus Gracilibacteria bacterium]